MNPPKKLLFIAGYFPPAFYSSGSVRAWNIAKYLSKLGWQVTVVTPSPKTWNPNLLDDSESVMKEISDLGLKMVYTNHWLRFMDPGRMKTPSSKIYLFFAGVFRKFFRLFQIPTWIGWMIPANLACSNIKPDEVDVILATGAPFLGFELAYRLSKRLNRPFVLDYRDLWTSNPWQKKLRRKVIAKERLLLEASSAVVVISPSIKEQLIKDYNFQSKINVITNGYDNKHMDLVTQKRFDHFSIVYAGGIIMPDLSLEPFFQALLKIKMDSSIVLNWKFHYLGPDKDIIFSQTEALRINDKVIIHGKLPQEETWSILRGANLSVIVTSIQESPTLAERGIITGKIFESIGLGTPMLVIAPKGSDVEQIVNTSGKGKTFAAQNVEQMVNYIKQIMVGNIPAVNEPNYYSWENLSLNLDAVLREVINQKKVG